jgi:hypothetical protein
MTGVALALQGDPRRAPLWLNALLLAEKGWGHPEDIWRRKGGVVWASRQAVLDTAREKKRGRDAQRARSRKN